MVLSVFAQSKTADVFALDFNVLSANKAKLKNGDKNLQKPYNKLLRDAYELVNNYNDNFGCGSISTPIENHGALRNFTWR
jgi:hypothetical protein